MCCITFWHQKLAVNVAARCETNDTQSQKPKPKYPFPHPLSPPPPPPPNDLLTGAENKTGQINSAVEIYMCELELHNDSTVGFIFSFVINL